MTSRIDSLREALAVSPQNIPLLLLFGYACADELSLAEARAAFDRILQADPSHVEAKLGIARVLYLSGNTSEAVVRAESLTKVNPGFAEAWLLLSRLAVAEGDRDRDQLLARELPELQPKRSPDPMRERCDRVSKRLIPRHYAPPRCSDRTPDPVGRLAAAAT